LQIFSACAFRQRAAEDGEVLREDVDEAPFHASPSGHHAVAEDLLLGEPEIGRAVRDEAIQLDERAGIEQHVEPLARRHFPFLMLRGDALGTAALLDSDRFCCRSSSFSRMDMGGKIWKKKGSGSLPDPQISNPLGVSAV